MADIKLKNICKNYNDIKAVSDLSLDIKDNEFIVLVGPSGCGKTTVLRLIAGLEKPSLGEIYIDGINANDIKPNRRSTSIMFQNYALSPHLTAHGNIAFGLKISGEKKEKINQKVLETAALLGISDCLKRKPHQLSGGQRQRTALGRAIVTNPKIFLLDEPLSNLDIKMRSAMREEILKLHEKLNAAFIYVTHDQTEAMTMGGRLVVMNEGRILQSDTPQNIYNNPSDTFVAGFVGAPQINFFNVSLRANAKIIEVFLSDTDKPLFSFSKSEKYPEKLSAYKNLIMGIRPEHIYTKKPPSSSFFTVSVTVKRIEDLGSESVVYAELGHKNSAKALPFVFKTEGATDIKKDTTISVFISKERLHFFLPENGKRLAG